MAEAAAGRTVTAERTSIERVLRLIGAWEHLDTEDGPDMLDELDRIRHTSKPTPPLER